MTTSSIHPLVSDRDSPLSPGLCDLHMHTTASDGTDTPEELVAKATRRGLAMIAITDHDTTGGIRQALATAETLPSAPVIIPGIELSTDHGTTGIHMLGYHVPHDSPQFQAELDELLSQRDQRNRVMVERINEVLKLDMTMEEVAGYSSGTVVARPHFARALVARGLVADLAEAFDLYLGDGRPCYAERQRFESSEAIKFLHRHGAYAVIAHPCLIRVKDSGKEVEDVIAELARAGVDGIEAVYSLHTTAQTAQFRGLAARHKLMITGGSDYHGSNKPDIALGSGYDTQPLAIPQSLAEPFTRPRSH